jgi:colicin import membrane protein
MSALRPGLVVSVALHAALAAATLVSFRSVPLSADTGAVVPIEIVTVSDATSVIPADPDAAETPDPLEAPPQDNTAEAPPEEVIAPEPEPVRTAEATPLPPPPTRMPPRTPPQRPQQELDLQELQRAIDRSRNDTERRRPQATTGSPQRADRPRSAAGFADALTVSEEDALRSKMARCWRTPADLPDPASLIVRLRVRLDPGGNLIGAPQLVEPASMPGAGTPLRIAVEAAQRAVRQCQPYDMLSPERHAVWGNMILRFDPTQMAAP